MIEPKPIPSAELFQALFERASSGERSPFARLIIPTGVISALGRISAFINDERCIGLQIPMDEEVARKFTTDTRSPSLTLSRDEYRNQPCALLTLKQPALRSVFEVFCDDFLDKAVTNPDQAALTASALLKRWRDLLSRATTKVLTPEEETGLIAELELLEQLLEERGEIAFLRWTGSDKARHDFRFDDLSIECKATTNRNGLFVEIHGDEQLTPTTDIPLRLVVRKYEATPTGEVTLPGIVDRIVKHPHVSGPELLNQLAEIGYLHTEETKNELRRYRFCEQHTFDVVNEFPRLLRVGASDRIQNIKYTIDLSSPSEIPGYRND
ncbi:PD-(D/E)XK motif protein [Corynebacterium freiburgense]|uniref:PD-(D/E)XK motif protein n=1 Tax=Corynebacterium freiburgense TaxID=556548 RepID=UPI00047B9093|nr:PD-(D/E)XK motif protein [Corynebacterium freiburgense]WJZ02322.1 hypothetical protein CFREI_05130 [Corynebacterium freiburgense]